MARVAAFSLAIQSSGIGFRAAMIVPLWSGMEQKAAPRRLEVRDEHIEAATQGVGQSALPLPEGVFKIPPARATGDFNNVATFINQIIANRALIVHSHQYVLTRMIKCQTD